MTTPRTVGRAVRLLCLYPSAPQYPLSTPTTAQLDMAGLLDSLLLQPNTNSDEGSTDDDSDLEIVEADEADGPREPIDLGEMLMDDFGKILWCFTPQKDRGSYFWGAWFWASGGVLFFGLVLFLDVRCGFGAVLV